MRRLMWVILLLSLSAPAYAEPAFESKDEVTRWMTNYYRQPDPDRVADAIAYMDESGVLDETTISAPLGGFLSGVFHVNPDRVPAWLDEIGALEEQRISGVVIGLWFADVPGSRTRAQVLLRRYPNLRDHAAIELDSLGAARIEQVPLEQGPAVLDALWGKFMATGDRAPVERIIEALSLLDATGDEERLIIGEAARWSLTSNAVQHPRVLAICVAVVREQKPGASTHLPDIIAAARERLAGRHKQGARAVKR